MYCPSRKLWSPIPYSSAQTFDCFSAETWHVKNWHVIIIMQFWKKAEYFSWVQPKQHHNYKKNTGSVHFASMKTLSADVWNCALCAGENLALQGKATQSTLHSTGIANNAIDGNRASAWSQGSCTHTGHNFNAWWRLDLGKTHKVFSVSVTNRQESPQRLNGAEIRIGDSLDNNGINNPR